MTWLRFVVPFSLLASGTAAAVTGAPQGLDGLEATRARPLFSPTRRPPPQPTVADVEQPVDAPAAPPPDIKVSGIIIGDHSRVALVKRSRDPSAVPVQVGSNIDGWTVAAIGPRAIELRLAERSVMVSMSEPGH